jgi:fucose 4-O-acetylase-like acetyltransferase
MAPYIGSMVVFGHYLKRKKVRFVETFSLSIPLNLLLCVITGYAIWSIDNRLNIFMGDERMAAFIVPIFLFPLNLLISIVMLRHFSNKTKTGEKLKIVE